MTHMYDPATFDPRGSIARMIFQVRSALASRVEKEILADPDLAPYEFTAPQLGILEVLHGGEADSASDLCKLMSYDRGAMSRMIDRLEKKGLVRRVRRVDERRTITLELTRQGEALLPKARAGMVRVLNGLLRGVSKSDVRDAETVLRRMLANAGLYETQRLTGMTRPGERNRARPA